MAKVNDQMPDLGKSINVFNNNRNVKNPFLENNNSEQTPSSNETAVQSSRTLVPVSNSSAEE